VTTKSEHEKQSSCFARKEKETEKLKANKEKEKNET